MTQTEKLLKIIDWFYNSCSWDDEFRPLDEAIDIKLFAKIEELVGEKLPNEYLELYSKFNGEKKVKGIGNFRGHLFFPLDMVIDELLLFKKNSSSEDQMKEYDKIPSFPKKAIKEKYFHFKWIPIFSDYCGNFIGIDLDPDDNGQKGQIIIYGKDESTNFVIADSLNMFFDLNLDIISKGGEIFKTDSHLHDIYKKIIMPT